MTHSIYSLLADESMSNSNLVAVQGFGEIENKEDIGTILRPYPYMYPTKKITFRPRFAAHFVALLSPLRPSHRM
jgi:hypothetical protein